MAAAEADPSLTIERFDKDGNLLKKDGSPYPTLKSRAPGAATAKPKNKKGQREEEDK